jgi:hypothetical protein
MNYNLDRFHGLLFRRARAKPLNSSSRSVGVGAMTRPLNAIALATEERQSDKNNRSANFVYARNPALPCKDYFGK